MQPLLGLQALGESSWAAHSPTVLRPVCPQGAPPVSWVLLGLTASAGGRGMAVLWHC